MARKGGIHRTLKTQQRSDMLRERVRDAVTLMGIGDDHYGIKQFARRAVAYGERTRRRTWSPRTCEPEQSAVGSIKNLLKLREDGTGGTGRSEHWVLDLFEGVLEEMYHGTPHPHPPVPDPALEQLDAAAGEVGVKVEAEPKAPQPAASLAMRMLEAFISRDESAIIGLAAEIERLEGQG